MPGMSGFYERLNKMSAERRIYTLLALTTHLEESGEVPNFISC